MGIGSWDLDKIGAMDSLRKNATEIYFQDPGLTPLALTAWFIRLRPKNQGDRTDDQLMRGPVIFEVDST